MFSVVRSLRKTGVLGINKRNADFILRYNERRFYPLVDDKIITKELAERAGVAVPQLLLTLEFVGQVRSLGEELKSLDEFAIKPARGSGGEGILVISGRPKGHFRKVNGKILTYEDVKHHIINMLSGMYSLGGHPDRVLIERRIDFDPVFADVSYQGVPDIRIIVFLGVPVMAMIRLPTLMSDGKANLHQGAIGAGIDITSGQTQNAVWRNEIVSEHPDTGASVVGLQIPRWDELLELASKCYELTGLGYQGVDLVLDKERGPLLLEINARPGLNVQIANYAGLLPRLLKVEHSKNLLLSSESRVKFAKELVERCSVLAA